MVEMIKRYADLALIYAGAAMGNGADKGDGRIYFRYQRNWAYLNGRLCDSFAG